MEIWKDITGYEGFYQVSNLGRVKSMERVVEHRDGHKYPINEKILSFNINKGYNLVGLSKNGNYFKAKVHRLVGQAFILNPNNLPEINHLNGIKNDNRVENLEWANRSIQNLHKYRILKVKPYNRNGIKNPRSLFTKEQIRIIRSAYKWGTSQSDLGKIFNVSKQVIFSIVRRKTYADIE